MGNTLWHQPQSIYPMLRPYLSNRTADRLYPMLRPYLFNRTADWLKLPDLILLCSDTLIELGLRSYPN